MKKLSIALAALLAGVQAYAADPIISATTTIYDLRGDDNYFTLYFGSTETTQIQVDCGNGPVAYTVKPAEWNSESQSIVATPVGCVVTSAATVKVYGDASKIDYFYAEGCYLNSLELGDLSNLEIINVEHNELPALDLSRFTKLAAVYVSDNPFSVTPFVLGNNHPNLSILEMAMVGNVDSGFNINTFPLLASFDAYATPTLRQLDPTNCPELLRISIDGAAVSSLDVSRNTKLRILNISDTRITDIDLSNNADLTELYATHESSTLNPDIKLSSINTSRNTKLYRLAVNGNRLTSIDISANTLLNYINVGANLLTTIDVSKCTQLSELDIDRNYMSFATMPLPEFMTYNYQQRPVQVDLSYKVGSVIDLSDKVLRSGTTTTAKLYAYSEKTASAAELDESYYTYADGKITLNKVVADSVYVQYSNSVFNEYPMTTSMFMVKNDADFGKPSKVASLGTTLSSGRNFTMKVTAYGTGTFYVDGGDGNYTEYPVTTTSFPRTGSGYISIYMPEGAWLTSLDVHGLPLTGIDLDGSRALTSLNLSGCGLYDVSLPYNRELKTLDLSHNNLSTIDLSGVNNSYSKNVLSHIDLSYNKLTSATLNDPRAITYLDLSNNRLEDILLRDYSFIEHFDISGNLLTSVNLSYMTEAAEINVSNNRLNEVILPETNTFKVFDLSGNVFTLENMPEVESTVPGFRYIYAPQSPLVIPTRGPGIDLTAQYRSTPAGHTSYALVDKASGTALVAGTDYTENAGLIRFLAPAVGKTVYVAMTNPAFPDFTGANVFTTTDVLASEFPTNLIAEFVTPVGGQNVALSLASAEAAGTTLYIDWSGRGTDLAQYVLKDTYTRFSATTVKDARVKVYTYSPDEHISVFSITGATMSEMDATKLVDLVAFTVDGGGTSNIKFPEAPALRELTLTGNTFTSFNLADFPGLISLALSNNRLTTFDASNHSRLQLLSLGSNQLTSVKLGNTPNLWYADFSNNSLAEIDLSGVNTIEQLGLSNNKLHTLDVSGVSALRALTIDHNYFDFTTLPPVKSSYVIYAYRNQNPVAAACVDGVVDLSSQAMVGTTPTEYTWWVGEPIVNDEGELEGEQLYVDDEYTVKDGVTTFNITMQGVQGVMTNAQFPGLFLRTNLLDTTSGIIDVTGGNGSLGVTVTCSDGNVEVSADVPDGTAAAIYTVSGVKVASATFTGGKALLRGVPVGAAVLTAGNTASKLVIR